MLTILSSSALRALRALARAFGDSSCMYAFGPIWYPARLDGSDHNQRPDHER